MRHHHTCQVPNVYSGIGYSRVIDGPLIEGSPALQDSAADALAISASNIPAVDCVRGLEILYAHQSGDAMHTCLEGSAFQR